VGTLNNTWNVLGLVPSVGTIFPVIGGAVERAGAASKSFGHTIGVNEFTRDIIFILYILFLLFRI
jgi:hypothetical protein